MSGRLVGRGIERGITVVCLTTYLASCTGWHNVPTVAPLQITEHHQSLRLTLRDGRQLELRKARIVGDSIIGESGHSSSSGRAAVALNDIQQVADRRISTGKTVFAIVGIAGLAFVVAAVAIASTLECVPLGCRD